MDTIQITVTENNDWEGETFSYILNVDAEMLAQIEFGLSAYNESVIWIDKFTSFTQESIKPLNRISNNTYMNRFGFYEVKELPKEDFRWYEDVFYKGVGLEKIKE
jgi:hypothetical protein